MVSVDENYYGWYIPCLLLSCSLLYVIIRYNGLDKNKFLAFLVISCPIQVFLFTLFYMFSSLIPSFFTVSSYLGNILLVLSVVVFETINIYILQLFAFAFSGILQEFGQNSRLILLCFPLWLLYLTYFSLVIAGSSGAANTFMSVTFGISGLLDIGLSITALRVLQKVKSNLMSLNQKLNFDVVELIGSLFHQIYVKVFAVCSVLLLNVLDPAQTDSGSVFALWLYILYLHLGFHFISNLKKLATASPEYTPSSEIRSAPLIK